VSLRDQPVDLGPESALSIPDGETAQTLRDRLDLALRYLSNWYRATKGSDNQDVWWARIDQERAKVEAAFNLMDPAKIFPGNAELAAYNDAAAGFPQLYRDLTLSADSLPQPDLLDVAASVLDAALNGPGYIITAATNAITKGVGNAAGKAFANLWPVLAVAAGVGLLYIFRAPLLRLAGEIK
jgi:hypothetical protein